MQKWHVHSAIGRGRPLSSPLHNQCGLTLPRHHFHTSSPHRNGRDKVMEEAATPSPNRAKRLEDASVEMQNLYLRHAGKDKSPSGHRNTAFKSVPLKGAPEGQPAVIDARNMGVPFGKEVLEGKSFAPRVDQGPRLRQERQGLARDGGAGAVDARALGAKPEGALERKHFTMGRSGTVDARALGAKPEGDLENRRFTLGRSGAIDARNLAARPAQTVGLPERQRLPPRRPMGDREQSMGLEEKRRFPPRVPRSGQEQDTEPRDRQPRGENSGFQDRHPRGGYGLRARNDNNGIQEHAPQRGTDFQARPTRGGFRGAPRGGGSARPRPVRDGGGGEPSKRRRGGGERRRGRNVRGNSSDVGYVNIWNEEEAAYMKQKSEEKAVRSAAFNPHDVPEQGLTEYIPAIMSGEQGISQILEERLTLAKKHLEGKFIHWDSKEQQADVMTLVEALKAEMTGTDGESKENEKEEVSKTKQEADALLEKLWMGKYELARPTKEKDVLGHVARQTDRNESYFPKDEKSLLKTLRSILPADARRRGDKAVKQARK